MTAAEKLRTAYAITPNAPFFKREFSLLRATEKWIAEGHIKSRAELDALCKFDGYGRVILFNLGDCEAPFVPTFDEIVLEDQGQHELVQDTSGRSVLCFKGRRDGFMPHYVDHPVKDQRTWEEKCLWRLDPESKERHMIAEADAIAAAKEASDSSIVCQMLIGAYMFLRSLMGPLEVMYMIHDNPELIHSCMEAWLKVCDRVTEVHQRHVVFDELYVSEDICFNTGPLISPDSIREFLFPYYQELFARIRRRQRDNRHLYIHVDTDGHAESVIPLYQELGMDIMGPFEVASGCDVVEIGKCYPNLVIYGGVDKRILAGTKDDIDRMAEYIFPAMFKRGGYIPTCDHEVPLEVPFENYLHFRGRVNEFA